MLGNAHFYNRTIRKIVVAFGTLFNDIYMIRYNKAQTTEYERIKVPLAYAPKEKFIQFITSDPTQTKSINVKLPRIGFEMDGITYDPSRKQMSTMQNFSLAANKTLNTQYTPVPYNFDFTLSIYVRNTEDGAQILEQILPFFTPDFTVTVDLIPSMNQKYDMPIILNSVSPEVDYEGDGMTTRTIVWTLTFTVKSWIFPPVKTGGDIIKSANTNFLIDNSLDGQQKVYVDFANGHGILKQSETIRVVNKNITGVVNYFSNTNNGILIIDSLSSPLSANDVVIGDMSNAEYTVSTLDYTKTKVATVIVRPDPATANADSDYGFEEIFNEWPDTL
jgi:hypothetical protein